ncbi:hypothetical protein AXF42_Ash019920 [Apostasia shenzhenica]|uniref:Uncharacterized protein n=1 Tax=Apostasia shenzhenica TaxID=1088818 RepID=A0A2H9ZYV1_9ASPA|nr:hypothetical protein AXF42_Ash019920 [Apostasia shenzhenica]
MVVDKAGNVILDIECLKQPPDKFCSASKSLARKNLLLFEKQSVEEQEADDPKKLFIKVHPPLLDLLKLPLVSSKAFTTLPSVVSSPIPADSGDGRSKRFQRLTAIHPRKILLFFATMSSIGTTILIYFTLAIHRRGGL